MLRPALRLSLTVLIILFTLTSYAEEKHWGYTGDVGPTHWADLNPDYATCKLGKEQSPVNITGPGSKGLGPIDFNYEPSRLLVVNNGHTIQTNYDPGSSITVNGTKYELQQFHFHHLSETTMRGRHWPLELHLVHKSADGKLAVVAVLLDPGKESPVVASVWKAIPKTVNEVSATGGTVNAAELLPADHTYYTFPGSLTTPPCSEGVTWLVLAKPMTVSAGQIAAFAKLYPNNSRPTQPLNGRSIREGGAAGK